MADVPDDRARGWARRGAEGLTIALSILLALAADAAWDYRGDRADEARLLEGLRAEFRDAEAEMAADLAQRDSILTLVDLALSVRTGGAVPPSAVPDVVLALLDWRFYTPGHAVFEDALTSGRLDLIRSDEIRLALMGYEQQRRRVEVFDERERAFVADQLEPYLAEHLALDRLTPDAMHASEAERLLQLLDDDAFASLISLKRQRTSEAMRFSRIVASRIEGVLTALAGEG